MLLGVGTSRSIIACTMSVWGGMILYGGTKISIMLFLSTFILNCDPALLRQTVRLHADYDYLPIASFYHQLNEVSRSSPFASLALIASTNLVHLLLLHRSSSVYLVHARGETSRFQSKWYRAALTCVALWLVIGIADLVRYLSYASFSTIRLHTHHAY